MAGLTIALCAMGGSVATAHAKGCEVLDAAGERAECVVRERAREQARAEVDRRVGAVAGAANVNRSERWSDALDEAAGVHPGDVLEPRPIATVVGLLWLALVARSRWRGRSRRVAG